MRTTIRAGLLGLGLAVATMAVASHANAQAAAAKRTPSASSNGARSRGSGADANIRQDDAPNAVNKAATPQPTAKGTRGASSVEPGQICVDSRVDLYVKIYVDGSYVGTVSPWGDACGYYGPGDHRIYGRALFTDGSSTTWGPVSGDATPGFKWTIRP